MSFHVLHVVPTFWPATFWGGPIFSTKAICDGISRRAGYTVRVLTTDSAGPNLSDRVRVGPGDAEDYPTYRARRVLGASVAPGLLFRLFSEMRRADVVHLTATYSFPTLPTLLFARLMGKPIVWSPRGALMATEEWAGTPKRRLKRGYAWFLRAVVPRATILHVTSQAEGAATPKSLGSLPVRIIPNGVEIPEENAVRVWRPNGTLRLVFMSRIHPKKGLEQLVRAMMTLPDWVRLDIFGDGDRDDVQRLLAQISGMHRIVFHGHADEATKASAFSNADLFVLPTWSENFGIVVAEALAHGVPVLTTNRTPWGGLDRYGCGHCFDPETDDLASEIVSLSPRDLEQMGRNGREWMRREFSQEAMCEAFAGLYAELAGKDRQVADAE